MGMCNWFFKDATKIQNGRQRSTPNFFVGSKTLKLKVRNYSNFTITFPTIWRCASDFLKVLLKFKMADMDKLHIFCGRKNWKIEISNNSHCTITLPTIWKCACDFTEIWNGHHKSTFLNICDRKKSDLIYGGGWSSCFLFLWHTVFYCYYWLFYLSLDGYSENNCNLTTILPNLLLQMTEYTWASGVTSNEDISHSSKSFQRTISAQVCEIFIVSYNNFTLMYKQWIKGLKKQRYTDKHVINNLVSH